MNHTRILAEHGLFWDYGGINPASAFYWTSLTILDPLAAVLLFLRPKAGISATVVLIVTNVMHNLAIAAHSSSPDASPSLIFSSPFLLSQIAFMLFVAISAPIAWRGLSAT